MGGAESNSSSDEEGTGSNSQCSSDGESLSPPIEHLGEDDLDMIESLSESSSGGSDREEPVRPLQDRPSPQSQDSAHPQSQPSKSKPRRQFTLAANFSLASTSTTSTTDDQTAKVIQNRA